MAARPFRLPDIAVDIERKRALLTSIRMRFSPAVQPIRYDAIDQLVRHMLLAGDCEYGMSSRDIFDQDCGLVSGWPYRIPKSDIDRSLVRLERAGAIAAVGVVRPKRFRLGAEALAYAEEQQQKAEARIRGTLSSVFRTYNVPDPAIFEMPFLRAVTTVLNQVTDNYIAVLTGSVPEGSVVRRSDVESAVREAAAAHPGVPADTLRAAVTIFFAESQSDFADLKWNIAQNLYIAKTFGLDPTGSLLSREVWTNTDLYLDTNVIISALEPSDVGHRTFVVLSEVCRRVGINLKVCHASIEELRRVVDAYVGQLELVGNSIPDGLEKKIGSVFFQLYFDRDSEDLAHVFRNFARPSHDLGRTFGVELVDDPWFVSEASSSATRKLSDRLKELRHKKTDRAAVHDALLLRWVSELHASSGRRTLVLTRDRTLPTVSDTLPAPAAVSFDGLLQWLAPIVDDGYAERDFVAMFSEALRLQLLPTENTLELKDFVMLREIGLECRDLPAEDVEGALVELGRHAATLDPGRAEDRERLHHLVSRFMSSPERVYKDSIRRLSLVEGDKRALDTKLVAAEQEIKSRCDELLVKDAALTDKDRQIAKLKGDFDLREKAHLAGSARLRIALALLLLAGAETTVVYAGVRTITGSAFVRASVIVPVVGFVGLLWRYMTCTALGKERCLALGSIGALLWRS